MVEVVKLDSPMTILTAGRHLLHGTAKGVLNTVVIDSEGYQRSVRLPAVIVPGLGEHLFSTVQALAKGASTIFSNESHIDLGKFKVPINSDSNGALQYISVKVSRKPPDPTALSTMTGADTWHRRLGHPTEQVMRRLLNTRGSGVNFEGSVSPCVTCKINKSVQKDRPKTVNSTNISERLQLVSTDLTGPITPMAQRGYRYMAKFTDLFTCFEVVYFITTLCRFIQDLAIP
ncbi:unnamed protein product [Sphacelaria rigidula]